MSAGTTQSSNLMTENSSPSALPNKRPFPQARALFGWGSWQMRGGLGQDISAGAAAAGERREERRRRAWRSERHLNTKLTVFELHQCCVAHHSVKINISTLLTSSFLLYAAHLSTSIEILSSHQQ